MKTNQDHTCRPATAKACLSFALALTLWLGCRTGLLAQAVPDRLNYQGILLSGQGTPVTAITDVDFRIWDTPTGTDPSGLKWGRMFKITPDTNGAFNVVLSGEGSVLSGAPDVSLTSVFTGTGSDARYLELTVAGSTAIRPRQRLVASPYAFLAQNVVEPRPNFSVSGVLTVNGAANVGTLNAAGALSAASASVGSLTVNAAATVGGALTVPNNTVTASNFVGYGTIPIGGIIMWSGTNVPTGWALCNGSQGTPDLRGRFVLASTNLQATAIGQTGGEATVTLTIAQMPSHKHDWNRDHGNDEYGFGGSEDHWYNVKAVQSRWMTDAIEPTGGGQPHNNMPPYYVLAFIMRVQ